MHLLHLSYIEEAMLPIGLVYFIPAVISILAFVYILVKIPKTYTAQVFLLFVGVSFVWQLSEGFLRISAAYETAMFWHKLLSLSVVLTIATGFHFSAIFVKNKYLVKSWWLVLGIYIPAGLFILAHALDLDLWYVESHPTLNWISDSNFTLFDKVEAIWMMIVALAFLIQMIVFAWKNRKKKGPIRNRAIIMSIGFFFPVIFGVVFQVLIPLISTSMPNLPLASPSMVFVIIAAIIALKKYRFLSYDPTIAADRILDAMDSSVIIFDHELKIKYINKTFEKLTGFKKNEIVDIPVSSLDTDLDSNIDFDPDNVNPEEKFEININTKNDGKKSMLVSFSEYIDPLNNHIGTIALLTDITEKNEMQERLIHEKKQALQYQSMLIGSQLNPHFIFNALNSIQYYILDQDVTNALGYVADFSTLMRTVLQNSLNKVISLSTEIEFLSNYMELELKRFQNKFEYTIEVKGELDEEDVFLPPMLIQPYIENAVVHGFSAMTSGGKLSVVFELLRNDFMKCTIKDNGVGITEDAMNMSDLKKKLTKHPSQGMGLLKKRIDILNEIDDSRYAVKVSQLNNTKEGASGTMVEVTFPIKDSA